MGYINIFIMIILHNILKRRTKGTPTGVPLKCYNINTIL